MRGQNYKNKGYIRTFALNNQIVNRICDEKLTIFFCGTLALAACGNGIEKKANEKLMVAQAAYERGDYEEAKSQIDSIKILYPKAFEARKAGQALMLDVETKAQQKTLAYLDSALRAKTEEFNAIKDKFILEKDAEYQQVGNYLWPTQTVEKTCTVLSSAFRWTSWAR